MAIKQLPKQYSSDFRLPNKKPIGDVEIDWGNPLSRGVYDAHYAIKSKSNTVQGLLGNNLDDVSSLIQLKPQKYKFNATSNTTRARSSSDLVDSPTSASDDFTITVAITPKAYIALATFYGFHEASFYSSGEGGVARMVMSFNGNYYFWGMSADFDTGITFDTDNKQHIVSFSKQGTAIKFYRDGVLSASSNVTLSSTIEPRFFIGGGHSGAASCGNFDFNLGVVHSRCLGDTEIKDLHLNPYQILKPKQAPVYFTTDGGGSTITVPATLGTISYAGQSTTVSVTGSIDVTATLGTIAYASSNTTVDISGSVDVIATLGAIDYTSNNTTVGITGSVDVTTTLGTISYTSSNTTVSVSGAVDVITTLGTIDYSSNNVTVDVTGSVDALATLGTITYTSVSPIVSIGGTIVVPSTLGTITYSSNDAVISLQGVVSVPATLGTISYASNDTVVSLAGLIDVNATLGTISYTSNNTTVTVAAGQTFGVVGVGFADDLYSSTFKPDSITVTFRG